ncbi:hypothetical protein D3C80_1426790 [compost metagenome]
MREQIEHFAEQLLHARARRHALFKDAVEQVFHGPGQFAQHQGAHHPAAALEGMESAAQFTQGRAVGGITRPAWQILTKDLQYFLGFFDEHFAQFLVDRCLA